jgi:hypothetical protein
LGSPPEFRALTRAGLADAEKLDQARLLFERVLGYANHLGLNRGQASTKDLRKAMVHYRSLFDELLGQPLPERKEARA